MIAKLPPGHAASLSDTIVAVKTVAVKTELTDSTRKKRKHPETVDLTHCLKDTTDALNKPAAVAISLDSKTALFFGEEGKLRKKECTSGEKLRIFQTRQSVWKEIRSIIEQKKDFSFVGNHWMNAMNS